MRTDQLLQTKNGEIIVQIFPEVRPRRVVAVTEHDFPSKEGAIMLQFSCNIVILGVELVIF